MTTLHHDLAVRVEQRVTEAVLSPELLEAIRLADMYGDLKPEEFHVPVSNAFDSYRPVEINKMLVRAA